MSAWINTMNIFTCSVMIFVSQVVCTQATQSVNYSDGELLVKYEIFNTPMSWHNAEKFCSNFTRKRSLAKVSSLEEMNLLNSQRTFGRSLWLGANDILEEGKWMWTDGTKVDMTSLWDRNEPNDEFGREDCLLINYGGGFNDVPCYMSLTFACMEFNETTMQPETTVTSAPLKELDEFLIDQDHDLHTTLEVPNAAALTSPPSTVTDESTAKESPTDRFIQSRNSSFIDRIPKPLNVPLNKVVFSNDKLFKYEIFHTPMSWDNAEKFCSNFTRRRTLAKVSSEEELVLLNSIRENQIWLGANDILKEGKWVWTDGTNVDMRSMWNYNEPNDLFGNEDCLVLNYGWTFNDVPCHLSFEFACMEFNETTMQPETTPSTTVTSAPLKELDEFFIDQDHDLHTTLEVPNAAASTSSPSTVTDESHARETPADRFNQSRNSSFIDRIPKPLDVPLNKVAVSNDKLFKYEIFHTPMSWDNAEKFCSNFTRKRTLAKVSSQEELNLLNSIRTNQLWLGANDILQEGKWVWTDGTNVDMTSLWDLDEPNDQFGNEDCLLINYRGTFNDVPCDMPLEFACMELNDQPRKIAFTIGLSKTLDVLLKDVIIYNKVVSDIGGNYDSSTGVFKCLTAGVYFFQIHGAAGKGKELSLSLMKNKNKVASLYSNTKQELSLAANSAVLLLEAGDEVYVESSNCGSLYGEEHHVINTFSGFLLD
ncbi:uncharacterized protein LOC131940420 isoform X2 [Physella acuta]|uniref:uncharacterized protein LOC131940420 isoform X2 n=1 Tax=Physella acuta TaxID=109671 RepID=UPI0027DD4788|nr:uncharacterized protein LOC131940420 isoform X2 [Physella acuta]